MNLDQYLEQFIEGYLFEDLRSMAPIKLPPGKRYGAVGYPMVMTVLSGIEVLGALTSKAQFSPGNGAARFGEFWRGYMYADSEGFQRLDSLVYNLIRHPLAHCFMTKPMIQVTKHHDPGHLCRTQDDVVIVDALTFADDLIAVYERRLKPQLTGAFKANMEARFREFREAYWQDHEAKKGERDKVPARPLTPIGVGVDFRINSPALPTSVYSTNVTSTTGFDDPNR